MGGMSFVRNAIWKIRQIRNRPRLGFRPVLDLVDFGSTPGIVLDVGASVGGFASQVLVKAPLMQVHCFEPNTEVSAKLIDNAAKWGVFQTRPRAVINQVGVGSKTEARDFIITELQVASSFLPVTDAATNGWPGVDFTERRREVVKVVRLDDYLHEASIEKVKLLKLDIQGLELAALNGCGTRLQDVEYIIAEVQFQQLYDGAPLWTELVGYAAAFGFRPVVMDGFCFGPDHRPLQADILLARLD